MSGGKASQCKGRGGEREARDILNAAGFSARCHGQWDPLDISCDFGDGKEVPGEVKRKKDGMGPAYKAFSVGAKFFMHRSDNKKWIISFTLDEFIHRYGPELQITEEGIKEASQYLPNGTEG
jgi:hypothetical protein